MFNYYSIDWNRFILQVLPIDLRNPRLFSYLRALIKPLVYVHFVFIKKRNRDLYRLRHNGQVCYLRAALNDSFDIDQRRIQVIGGRRFNPVYIYTDAEQNERYIYTDDEDNRPSGNTYLYDDSVYADTGVDFIVLIPFEVWNLHKVEVGIGEYRFYDIEALVNFYKLASKRYTIELL